MILPSPTLSRVAPMRELPMVVAAFPGAKLRRERMAGAVLMAFGVRALIHG